MKYQAIVCALGLTVLLSFTQNCSTTTERTVSQTENFNIPILKEDLSFSMTGSTRTYDLLKGNTEFYTQKLEEIYPNGIIDFINSPDPLVRKLIERIPFESSFRLVLINTSGVKNSMLQINDEYHPANKFGRTLGTTPAYSFASTKANIRKLEKLRLHIKSEPDAGTDIHESALACVTLNAPGPKGEYRNGALTLQLVDAKSYPRNHIVLAEFTVHRESTKSTCTSANSM